MSYTKPSRFETILGRFGETLVVYLLLVGIGFVVSATMLTGHFPPTKEEVMGQVKKVKEVVNRSQEIVDGIKVTNERIAEVGPQFEVMGRKIQELEQRVQTLEQDLKSLKALRR